MGWIDELIPERREALDRLRGRAALALADHPDAPEPVTSVLWDFVRGTRAVNSSEQGDASEGSDPTAPEEQDAEPRAGDAVTLRRPRGVLTQDPEASADGEVRNAVVELLLRGVPIRQILRRCADRFGESRTPSYDAVWKFSINTVQGLGGPGASGKGRRSRVLTRTAERSADPEVRRAVIAGLRRGLGSGQVWRELRERFGDRTPNPKTISFFKNRSSDVWARKQTAQEPAEVLGSELAPADAEELPALPDVIVTATDRESLACLDPDVREIGRKSCLKRQALAGSPAKIRACEECDHRLSDDGRKLLRQHWERRAQQEVEAAA